MFDCISPACQPHNGIICGGLNAYCMQTGPLFLRTSGSSGVLKALLHERNGQLYGNPKKKKKTLASSHRPYTSINGVDSMLLKLLHKPTTRTMEWVRRILLSHILILQKESTTSHAATGMLSAEAPAASSISEPQHPSSEPPLASESAPRRSSRAHTPVSPYWKVPPVAPGGAQ